MLPLCQPLPVVSKTRPFDGAEWIFELKYDGFRALAYIEHGRCRLVSRNGHQFSCFFSLASSLAQIGRHELFERERHSEPVPGWHNCDLVCAELEYAKL